MGLPFGKKCTRYNLATFYDTIADYNYHLKVAHQAESEYIGGAYKCGSVEPDI